MGAELEQLRPLSHQIQVLLIALQDDKGGQQVMNSVFVSVPQGPCSGGCKGTPG